MKHIFIILILVITYTCISQANNSNPDNSSGKLFYGSFKLIGCDFPGELKFNTADGKYLNKFKVQKMSFSMSLELFLKTFKKFDIGIGTAFLLPRDMGASIDFKEFYDNAEALPNFYFVPLYLIAKFYPYIDESSDGFGGVFIDGKLGYNLLFNFESFDNCKGFKNFNDISFYGFSIGYDGYSQKHNEVLTEIFCETHNEVQAKDSGNENFTYDESKLIERIIDGERFIQNWCEIICHDDNKFFIKDRPIKHVRDYLHKEGTLFKNIRPLHYDFETYKTTYLDLIFN